LGKFRVGIDLLGVIAPFLTAIAIPLGKRMAGSRNFLVSVCGFFARDLCDDEKISSRDEEIFSVGTVLMSSDSLGEESRSPICFVDRVDAGSQLADAVLAILAEPPCAALPVVVYALPRGGLPVAAPIAQRLNCPLSVLVAKKITRPENPELAIGAVTADGHVLWLSRGRSLLPSAENSETMDEVALVHAQERAQAQWQQLSNYCSEVNPKGAIALIVDDGIATGMTIAVAAQALRVHQPAQIWLCVPVAPPEILPALNSWGDRVIVLATPHPFYSVSRFYQKFPQVEMAEAIACLQQASGLKQATD
jgi:putative phosphoribosyl transferase